MIHRWRKSETEIRLKPETRPPAGASGASCGASSWNGLERKLQIREARRSRGIGRWRKPEVGGDGPDPEIHPTAQAERMQAEEEAVESPWGASLGE